MTDTIAPDARAWRSRRLRLLLVLGALLLSFAYVLLDVWAGHRVNVAVARLENQVGSLDENTLRRSPVPAEDNRARVVRAAVALSVRSPKNVSDFSAGYNRFIKSGAPAPVPTVLRAFVEANRAALHVAEDTLSRDQSDWEFDYRYDGPRASLLDIRTLSNAMYLSALMDLEAGRPEDAAKTIATGLAVSASLGREPDLVTQLIRIVVGMQQFEAVHRLVVQSEPSPAALEDLAKRLIEARTADPARIGLVSELKHVNAALTRVESGRSVAGLGLADLFGVSRFTRNGSDSPFWVGPLQRLSRPYVRLVRARYLLRLGDLLALQAGPRPHPSFPPFARPSRWSWTNQVDYMSAGLERSIDTADRFTTTRGAAELVVALRRFRLDHGSYPDALSALVPAYVSALPIDAFTGQPPVYERVGAGFRLRAQQGRSDDPQKVSALEWTVPR